MIYSKRDCKNTYSARLRWINFTTTECILMWKFKLFKPEYIVAGNIFSVNFNQDTIINFTTNFLPTNIMFNYVYVYERQPL